MKALPTHDVTRLLREWQIGDEQALGQLVDLVYSELHRAAHCYMVHEQPWHTLQTTALIHEMYLQLVDLRQLNFRDRTHFLALCARLMRRILVDFARARKSKKRGGGQIQLSIDDAAADGRGASRADLLVIDEALNRLSLVDLRKAKVVEMMFFGGLTEEETAGALDVSVETVRRDWKFAKAWLRNELGGGNRRGSGALAPS
jgi:RNA polymerase sigma-70 factor, ECF subfamily